MYRGVPATSPAPSSAKKSEEKKGRGTGRRRHIYVTQTATNGTILYRVGLDCIVFAFKIVLLSSHLLSYEASHQIHPNQLCDQTIPQDFRILKCFFSKTVKTNHETLSLYSLCWNIKKFLDSLINESNTTYQDSSKSFLFRYQKCIMFMQLCHRTFFVLFFVWLDIELVFHVKTTFMRSRSVLWLIYCVTFFFCDCRSFPPLDFIYKMKPINNMIRFETLVQPNSNTTLQNSTIRLLHHNTTHPDYILQNKKQHYN